MLCARIASHDSTGQACISNGMGDNQFGKKLMKLSKKSLRKLSTHLKTMKEHGHKVDQNDYDFVDYSVKQIIDYIWRPTQKSISTGLLSVN